MTAMVSSTASSACEISSREPCAVKSCVGGGVEGERGWRHAGGLRLRLREGSSRRRNTTTSSMAGGGFVVVVDGTTNWWAQS